MQKEMNNNKLEDNNAIPDQMKEVATDVAARGRIGGLYTKEMVRRGEEIAKEIANPTK